MKRRLQYGARTPLLHVGGEVRRRGDDDASAALAHAVDVAGTIDAESAARAHVHGFHSYPARLHPVTASRLVTGLSSPGAVVLDPFCGSGTVLVEARLAGARARGTDVNPLALRLARLKARGVPPDERRTLLEAVRWVAGQVERRRQAHAPLSREYEHEDVELFEPHVLREVDSLRESIDRVEPRALREDVELVFSAILTKASRRRGDSGAQLQERRLAPGFVTRIFVEKAEELARALAVFHDELSGADDDVGSGSGPSTPPPLDVRSDDARVLGTVGARTIDLVVTSPPYAATYDYLDHHDIRLRWLRLRADRFDELEVGARRKYARLDVDAARARWEDELGRTFAAIARVLSPSGIAVVVMADSAVAGGVLRGDEMGIEAAGRAGMTLLAAVSQPRPHFHIATRYAFADSPREEHVLAFRAPPAVVDGSSGPEPGSGRD